MTLAIAQWALGFLIVLIITRVFSVKVSGLLAMIYVTVFPYGIGVLLFELFKIGK